MTDYTIEELAGWVHLLIKRSRTRAHHYDREADLINAQSYLCAIKERGVSIFRVFDDYVYTVQELADLIPRELAISRGSST
jgi:hypothetical protein